MHEEMLIIPIPAFADNYIWLLVNPTSQSVVCVDPGVADGVIGYLQAHNLALNAILLTHHHNDHTGGVADLLNYCPKASVYGPRDSRIIAFPQFIQAENTITIENLQFRVLLTPGHTTSHLCFYEPSMKVLFCGDTLFSAGCGRIFEGTPEIMLNSLLLLKNLPKETKIYCGHEYTRQNLRFAATIEPDNETIRSYLNRLTANPKDCSLPSTIALEHQINPFLRIDESCIKQYVQNKGIKLINQISIFTQLRSDKDSFS